MERPFTYRPFSDDDTLNGTRTNVDAANFRGQKRQDSVLIRRVRANPRPIPSLPGRHEIVKSMPGSGSAWASLKRTKNSGA